MGTSDRRRHLWLYGLTISLLIVAGCATYQPRPIEDLAVMERAHTKTIDDVRIRASVLSTEESELAFDIPLYARGIQPVWLKIENNTDQPVWFLPTSVDANYFAPLEVAYMHRATFSRSFNTQMDQYLYEKAMGRYIAPRSVKSGFVFTNLHQGTKSFNVDVTAVDPPVRTFTFFIPVPGFRPDYKDVKFETLYSENEIIDLDEAGLRETLGNLPCCTSNADGSKQGDPLNIVIVAEGEDILYSLLRSGWTQTTSKTATSKDKQYSDPNLYPSDSAAGHFLFGRTQDATFRKLRAGVEERNRLRLWLSPMKSDGKLVWIGQIGHNVMPSRRRDSSTGFRLDADVDEARDYFIQDLLYSQSILQVTAIKGFESAPISKPRENFESVKYFTDGYRTVFWISRDPISFEGVEFLEWDKPPQR